MTLYLTVFKEPAGHFNGYTNIALVEAVDENTAKIWMVKQTCIWINEPDKEDYEDEDEDEKDNEQRYQEAWKDYTARIEERMSNVEVSPVNGPSIQIAAEKTDYDG